MQTVATASRADQTRALSLSTIAFTACFAVWTIFSIIGVAIKAELGLNDTQFGLLVATPILTGSITRLFLGVWTEKYGGRLVFSSQMILTALATWALTLADSYIMYLIAALGIDTADRVVGDGAIILAAYLRWGPACPERLLGDFAFAIWDPRHRRLYAARDKVGMRQLTYHFAPGSLFACATDPQAVIAHGEVPKRVNETRIADFIDQLEAADHVS
ncbi:MAG: MFS transporter, partial [Rhodospirillales bacterium]|nr:MFS transporter [Rhodospirillales bacterium]